ncbi:TlpA family protein disulfide reductase [Cyclobacterium plantarum]|uniref:TlpA family protein disulfide reductase n=1 Tax=Cyclobacterium plantarum TaxID=2716263 RepID=A0ABX0HBJ1_9BACT|nr:TlpA disulfide reductase family protein [Cyclobacterium plantarum]NHE57806.1 TlpA family protein disulfide reductase [Cyclobacterium plantarum]
MRRINSILWVLIVLLVLFFSACGRNQEVKDQDEQENSAEIVLVLKDSLVRDFLRERKATLKYLDDANMPVTIDFSGNENNLVLSIDTERKAVDLMYTDNSQTRYSYLLAKGDSIFISLDERRPWLKTLNSERSVYDDNLELLRNRELYHSTYTPLQDFHFLWQANFNSPTPVDLSEERIKSRKKALESGEKELSWLDSLKNTGLIAERTASFYKAKLRFELDHLHFFSGEKGIFDPRGALDHFTASITDSSEYLQTVYFDEFSDFLLAQIKAKDPNELLLPDSLVSGPSPFSKRMRFKLLEESLPRLSFQEADKWLNSYGNQLENKVQADFLKARINTLKKERPDMELMGLGNHLMSFEELLHQKRGSYLYVDLWAAWCIPCIKAFPALRNLHEQNEDRSLEVIHLSVDKNHKFWEQVVRKHGIAFPNRSFIVLNLGESSFLYQLDVAFIPRYLLFDPKGKLIHQNAPGPDQDDIEQILDGFLR